VRWACIRCIQWFWVSGDRPYDGSDMAGLRSFHDSTSKRVLDLLETR